MSGYAFLLGLFAAVEFWYGGRPFATAVLFARRGILHVPALVLGGVQIWAGGLFAFAAGTLLRDPPSLPSREIVLSWTFAVFVAVLAIVVLRRPEVEARLPEDVRRSLDGRYVAVGAVVAAIVFFAAGYYWPERGNAAQPPPGIPRDEKLAGIDPAQTSVSSRAGAAMAVLRGSASYRPRNGLRE